MLALKAERAAAPPKHIDRPLLTPYSHSCKLVGFAAVLFGAETQRSAAGDHHRTAWRATGPGAAPWHRGGQRPGATALRSGQLEENRSASNRMKSHWQRRKHRGEDHRGSDHVITGARLQVILPPQRVLLLKLRVRTIQSAD